MDTAQPGTIRLTPDGEWLPISKLKEDMETLLLYAKNNDNCDEDEIDKIDQIQERWKLND